MSCFEKLSILINKKVLVIKGIKSRKNAKYINPEYILFDDGETYITLEDQDYHAYHDCSSSAKELEVCKNKERWEDLLHNEDYGDYTTEL